MARAWAVSIISLLFVAVLAAPSYAGQTQTHHRSSHSNAAVTSSVLTAMAPACLRCSPESQTASARYAHEVVSSLHIPPADPSRCEMHLQHLICSFNCSDMKTQSWASVDANAFSGISFVEAETRVSTTVRVCSHACEQFGAACGTAGSVGAVKEGGLSFVEKKRGGKRAAHQRDAGQDGEDSPGFLHLHTTQKSLSRDSAKAKQRHHSCVSLKLPELRLAGNGGKPMGLAFVSVDGPATGVEQETQGNDACLSFLQLEQPSSYTGEQMVESSFQAPYLTRLQSIAEHDQLTDPSTLVPAVPVVPVNSQPVMPTDIVTVAPAYPAITPSAAVPAAIASQEPSTGVAAVSNPAAPAVVSAAIPSAPATPASPTPLAAIPQLAVSSSVAPVAASAARTPVVGAAVPGAALPEALTATPVQPVDVSQPQPVAPTAAQPLVPVEVKPAFPSEALPVVSAQAQPAAAPQAQPMAAAPQAQPMAPAVKTPQPPVASGPAAATSTTVPSPVAVQRVAEAPQTVSLTPAAAASPSTVSAQSVSAPATQADVDSDPATATAPTVDGATISTSEEAGPSQSGAAETMEALPPVAGSQVRLVGAPRNIRTTRTQAQFREAPTIEIIPADGFCMNNCECWPVWASAIVVFVIYLAATFTAIAMTASLFSRGLWSSTFYRGGGNWLVVASVTGALTGGLVGGLVTYCVAGGLGLAAGLMTLCCSILLVGRRGAWLGAMGGVLTGGVVGGMINTGGLAFALGAGVGLLLGIICGFAPVARQLKVNERYIRQGMAASISGNAGKKHQDAARRGDGGMDHARGGYDPLGSGGEESHRQPKPSTLGNTQSSRRPDVTAGSVSRLRSLGLTHQAFTAEDDNLLEQTRSGESDGHEPW
ncbi:putative transmembrane domain protein [Toxoplasma gondii RUB]|uniref:Putative transmembrane domain protein n=1 Tax=Toxoplasma gondii RUB TaxID=935652 RepID=A0A086LQ48_TOXGO|nr:putative transmembrane domain protein [Toxoplasma gondii RUB]